MFENLTSKFEEIFSSLKKAPSLNEAQVDEGLRKIRQALLEADVALPVAKELIKKEMPIFGICLGHQILALTLGAKTKKMKLGHRGANHPVKNLIKNNVEITSQNHGFEIIKESLPKNIEVTHKSLFDNCIEGIRLKNKPVFSVQYHPEARPGPHDPYYLFGRFRDLILANKK